MEERTTKAVRRINGWMKDHGLKLSEDRTQAVVMSDKRRLRRLGLTVKGW